MAGKWSRYQEKKDRWKEVLYYFVVLCLIAAILGMYRSGQKQKQDYKQLVWEAAAQDQSIVIEPRKAEDLLMDDGD